MKYLSAILLTLMLTGCFEDSCKPKPEPDRTSDWGYMGKPQQPGAFGR